ncbi:hypothetical protein PV10_06163 [Exophiala mesophila]|uniref:Mediator of RNA polymerase II transcription subunit 6 n=1 Tax=Exophiala mesophila TaxID=212818 RepID=A0A0D1ZAD9_EXOME|nr:uncharacterized protein PV10_06163 [Exophiala mesophila]KIV91647.1 hypothetical protein PV10_06163 [Exophiala mesophila]
MTEAKEDLTEKAHYDPQWIAWNGGYLHSNNVLFYFATSPFFDQVSGNQSLTTQWTNTPNQNDILGTRQKFEANLRHQRGLQYVVDHDPLEEKVFVDGPNGREASNVWVIRKQHRENESESGVTVLGYYYIVNDVIYQAPSVASVLNYRMLNTVGTLNKMFSGPSELSTFTPSHGHSYSKPSQKSTAQALTGALPSSTEDGPTAEAEASSTDKPSSSSQIEESDDSSQQTLWNALRMTLQYGKEYMDQVPLVGEPGNFRFNKARDPPPILAKGAVGPTATGSPLPSRAASAVPAPKAIADGDKSALYAATPKKRRKSKAENSTP